MTSDSSLNPFSTAQSLITRYHQGLREILQGQNIAPADIDFITRHSVLDSGVLLARNPRYQRVNHSLAREIQMRGWDERIAPEIGSWQPYQHQVDGFDAIAAGQHTVIATGTGSGKSETFLLPLLNACAQSQNGVVALLIYPMKSLANDQLKRIQKYTQQLQGFTLGKIDGDDYAERGQLVARPPALLLTNFVMLDHLLTNPKAWPLFTQSRDTLRYVVLDELHSYTGSKAAHLRHLLARLEGWLSHKPQYIGASATLGRGEAAERDMQKFASDLWRTEPEQCVIIRPTEIPAEVEPTWSPGNWTAVTPPPGTFHAKLEVAAACRALTAMTGTSCSRQDLTQPAAFEQTAIYGRMRSNTLVAYLRHRLDEGAIALPEIIRWAREHILCPEDDAEAIVTSWMEAVIFLNFRAGKDARPLLDFRTHIFFRELGPQLRRCVRCRRYIATRREYCPHCGGQTGLVPASQPKAHLVMMTGQDCSFDPLTSSHPSGAYLALLHHADEYDVNDTDQCAARVHWSAGQPILADREGGFVLTPLADKPGRAARTLVVGLVPRSHSHESLRMLFAGALEAGYGPCLAFLDSRKRASYLDERIRDAFLSAYARARFEQALVNTGSTRILHAYADACAWFDDQPFSVREREVLAEFGHWYLREIGQPLEAANPPLLELTQPDGAPWTELERELLGIFLQERAIDRTVIIPDYFGADEARFFRRRQGWAEQQRAIQTVGADGDEEDDSGNWASISLSEGARKYRGFVEMRGAEAIANACEALAAHGTLRKVAREGKAFYMLQPEIVQWVLPDVHPANPSLYLIDLHTSERTAAARARLETDLKTGEVDIVFATSTLELGIDVGSLNAVFLIGVPPSPANYAQRAGRAGRGEQNRARNALIVTYCLDGGDRPYEQYYLEHPVEMVDGHIASPHFRSDSPVVLEKHLAAELIPALKAGRSAYPGLTEGNSAQFAPQLKQRFGVSFDYAGYCQETLLQQAAELEAVSKWWVEAYDHGIFPDYGFNRDLVYLARKEDVPSFIAEPGKRDERALTERTFELALIDLVPGRVLSVGGASYTVFPTDAYKTLNDGAHQYAVFGGREEKFGREVEPKMEIERRLPRVRPELAVDQLFAVQPVSDTLISLRCAVHSPEAHESAHESEDAFATDPVPPQPQTVIGYDFNRSGLLFAFARIVDEATLRSVLAVLRRQIARHLRVREMEISLLPSVELAIPDSLRIFAFLYDADGNASIPFEQAQADFAAILRASLDLVTTCSCDTNGCPNCVVGFDSFQQGLIDRERARQLLEHLVNGTPYRPHLESRRAEPDEGVATAIEVHRKGGRWHIAHGTENRDYRVDSDEAPSLFDSVGKAIHALVPPETETLIVRTNIPHLAQAIEKHQSKKGGLSYATLKTSLLRFRHVTCERLIGS